jgi:hypothetical protein
MSYVKLPFIWNFLGLHFLQDLVYTILRGVVDARNWDAVVYPLRVNSCGQGILRQLQFCRLNYSISR